MGYRSRLGLLLCLLLSAGCAAQAPPTPTPSSLYSNVPNYSGVLLSSELDAIQDETVEIRARVIEDVDSLENDDPIVIYRSAEQTIFQCNVSYHTGGRVGAVSHFRVCAMDANHSAGRVVAQEAYNVSISPDEQWVAILGDTVNSLFECQHQVYIAPLSLDTLQPLIDPTLFDEGLRSCAVNDLTWDMTDTNYTVTFSLWTGGSGAEAYPIYSISFTDPESPSELTAIPLQ